MPPTDRIHGLDALRATMMLLGVVFHTALTYSPADYGYVWRLQDPLNTHASFATLATFLHTFRMPAFFVVAGFFGALLFYDRGPRQMLRNRILRIAVPFVLGLPILWKLTVAAFTFTLERMAGSPEAMAAAWTNLLTETVLPRSTIHLWFLYDLIIFSLLACVVALALRRVPAAQALVRAAFTRAHRPLPVALIALTGLTTATFHSMGTPFAPTSASFVPDVSSQLFYLVFYLYGWLLHRERQVLSRVSTMAWPYVFLGPAAFGGVMWLDGRSSAVTWQMVFCALSVWCLVLGSMGLFLRYASQPSKTVRYLSDSSYWIYLIHLPLVGLLPGLLTGVDVPAFAKFVVVLVLATVLSAGSFHILVRRTWVGLLLNGRRMPSTPVELRGTPALS